MHREDERLRLGERDERGDGLAERLRVVDERRPVQRHEAVPAGLEAECAPRRVRLRVVDVLEHGVDHRVADELDALGSDPLAAEVVDGALRVREQEVGEMVGELAVVLLRHRPVEAAEPGLDVRERNARLRRGERAGERGVHVARDDDRGRLPLEEHLLDADERSRDLLAVGAGADTEEDVRLGQVELGEKDIRHRRRRSAAPCGRGAPGASRARRTGATFMKFGRAPTTKQIESDMEPRMPETAVCTYTRPRGRRGRALLALLCSARVDPPPLSARRAPWRGDPHPTCAQGRRHAAASSR